MRYRGQEHTVEVPINDGAQLEHATLADAFHAQHRRRYTFALEQTAIEIVNFRVTATAHVSLPAMGTAATDASANPQKGTRPVWFADGSGDGLQPLEFRVYERALLPSGFSASGPLIVEEPSTTTIVEPGQALSVDGHGNLVIQMER
jgi:N-methylhydantoinase A